MAWMESAGFRVTGCAIGVSSPSKDRCAASATGVRGVVATEDLPCDHVLFRVPSEAVLSAGTSRFSAHISGAGLRGWSALIAAITLENADPASPWRAYLDALPKQLDTPLFWTERELELLAGTRVVERANGTAVGEHFERVMTPFYAKVSRKLKAFSLTEEDCSLETWIRFGSIVLAYSFTIGGGGGGDSSDSDLSDENEQSEETVLLPFADFLNATPTGVNARLYYGGNGCLEMTTTEPVPCHAELINSYGDRANSELLLRYGYIAEQNPDDAIAFSLGELHAAATELGTDAVMPVRLKRNIMRAIAQGRLPPLAPKEQGPFSVREAIIVVGRRWRGVGGFGTLESGVLFELCDSRVVKRAAEARLRLLDRAAEVEKVEFSGELGANVARRVDLARKVRAFHRKMLDRVVAEASSRREFAEFA